MLRKFMALGMLLALFAAQAFAGAEGAGVVLRAYGPGGPHHVIQEAAELFTKRYGITVGVVKASPFELANRLGADGDIYFTGAEYMLDEFAASNPGIIDPFTVTELHPRRVGIVVRKGNPLGIQGVACLGREEVDLLSVRLEDMSDFQPIREDGAPTTVSKIVYTGSDGLKAWRSDKTLDAWVTYKTWHVQLDDGSEFIELTCDHALRNTMVAVASRSANREAALKFIEFLKNEESRRIFLEHGWE